VWKEPSARLFPKIRRKKQGRGFKDPDIAVLVNCIDECIELCGASCSLVGGSYILIT